MIKSKVKYAYALVFFYWPTIAYAKLSDVAGNVSGEARTILGEVVYWFQVLGIITAFSAIVSLIRKKKNNRDIDWEPYGIIFGVLLFLGLMMLGELASSVSGSDVNINVESSSSNGF